MSVDSWTLHAFLCSSSDHLVKLVEDFSFAKLCILCIFLIQSQKDIAINSIATLVLRECEDEDSHSQVSSYFGSWSPNGLLNF
jgi:hypothetical protein